MTHEEHLRQRARQCAVDALLALLPQRPAERQPAIKDRVAKIRAGMLDEAVEVRSALIALGGET